MGATRRDISGVFGSPLRTSVVDEVAVSARLQHLSPRGITFITRRSVPEWTELGVEVYLPTLDPSEGHHIDCRGVVVQCQRRATGPGFQVELLFLDLSKRAQERLTAAAATPQTSQISLSR